MIFPQHDTIEEHDFVVVFVSPSNMSCHQVASGLVVKTSLGPFSLGKAIGMPFGCHFWNDSHTKRVALLKPTPDLWTRSLPHRTQILYFADIAFVLSQLHIAPGSIVLECGTGSGSMTHSLAKAVTATGRVHTFEFHPQRVALASDEFVKHALLHPAGPVSCEHRDVGKLGFPGGLDATAAFLDLPNPWDVVPKLHASVDRAHTFRVCCFSPCIEQVLKNHEALRASGFTEIVMYETLQQELQILDKRSASAEKASLMTVAMDELRGHTSYLSFASLPPAH